MSRSVNLTAVSFLILLLAAGPVRSKERVAVLDFESIPANANLAQSVSEILRTELINLKQYEVVERAAIEKIFTEQKLRLSDAIDEKDAIRIGQLAGANIVVIGSIVKIGSTYTLNSRFIDVETGIAREGKSLRCTSEDEISNLCLELARSIAGKSVSPDEKAISAVSSGTGYLVVRLEDDMNENCTSVTLTLNSKSGVSFYREIPGEYLGNLHGYDRYRFYFQEKVTLPAGHQELIVHIPGQGNLCKGIKNKAFSFTLNPGEVKILKIFFKNFLVSRGWQIEISD